MIVNYKRLPEELKKGKMSYKLHWRDKDYAIYSVESLYSSFVGYEAFEIRRHDGYEIAGQKIEAAEIYPKNEYFGVTAFFCKTLDRALYRIKQLKKYNKEHYNKKNEKV